MKARTLLVCVLFAAPQFATAADKAIQELQRDIAILQQQVKDLQRSQDEKLGAVTELARQAIDAANHANTGVAGIQSSLDRTLKEQGDKVVAPVVNLGTRMTDLSGRVDTLQQAVADLTSLLNRMDAKLTDVGRKIDTSQQPVQVPVPGGTTTPAQGGPAPSAASPSPCMPAEALYSSARADWVSGKYEIAIPEFTDYLRCYGTTDYAPNAQFYIAFYHYSQKNFEQAVHEFDMVLEKYPDNNKTADALLYKGKALVQMPGHRTDGGNEFRELIKRYPRSDQSKQACDELKAIGMNCPAGSAAAPRKSASRKK